LVSAQHQTPVRVLVVDDSDVCQHALCAVVTATPGFEVVGTASSGREALELVASVAGLQLVLLDVHMPGLNGIETALRILRRHPDVVVALLTASGPNPDGETSLLIEDKLSVSPRWLSDLWRRQGKSG
jgi:DNA-binding NarL/FixJ family response regulator